MHFLKFYVIFENEELNVTFDSEAKILIDKNDKDMGIHEQLLEYFKGEGLTSGLIPGLDQDSKKAYAEGQAIRRIRFLDAARAKGMAEDGEFDMAVLLAEEKARHIAEKELAIRLAEEKAKGIAEAKEMEVRNLIAKHGFSDQQIMDFAEVSMSYVKRIRKILLSMN